MKKQYTIAVVRDREAGNIIEFVNNIEDGEDLIEEYEKEDRKNGNYTPDFYEAVNIEIDRVEDSDGVTGDRFVALAEARLNKWIAEHPDRIDKPHFDESPWIDPDNGGVWRWDIVAQYGHGGFDHGAIIGYKGHPGELRMGLCDDSGVDVDESYYR